MHERSTVEGMSKERDKRKKILRLVKGMAYYVHATTSTVIGCGLKHERRK